MRVDTFSSAFPKNPHYFKLVVSTNLFGDILSDQVAGLAGGIGMVGTLNAGFEQGMAQAAHGTAPDIAGKGVSNPSALILSVALLMNWYYQRTKEEACRQVADLIDGSVRRAVERGVMTGDLGGKATTVEFTDAVISSFDEVSLAVSA
jgi:3-isopropylmalate dehydrogenase